MSTVLPEDLFVSEKPVARDIQLNGDTKHTLHFREVADAVLQRYFRALDSTDEDVRAGARAVLISHSLCDDGGTPALTVVQAARLRSAVMKRMVDIIIDIHTIKPAAGNDSAPGEKTGSGTS